MLNTARTTDHPEVAQLRRFRELGDLDYPFLQQLAGELSIETAPAGTRLLKQGATEDTLLFLLRGQLRLKALDGGVQRIGAEDESARSPIARLRPSRYEVVTESNVSYLSIPSAMLTPNDAPAAPGLELYEVVEEPRDEQGASEDQLAFQLYEDLKSNQLLLPSLPDVAIRVGRAVNHDFADANRVARVIENDPVIAAKLIKVANSARYGGKATIAGLSQAIARIGLRNTHSLIITFALRELFRCKTPSLNRLMQEQWEMARELGAVCHVLASQCRKVDPETALLGGLVHNIGCVAVITHAQDHPALSGDITRLKRVVDHLSSQVGKMILTYWGFPKSLVDAAGDDPTRAHDGPCDTADLVTVARHHIMAANRDDPEAPALKLPAYDKLSLEPEMVDTVLQEAQSVLKETISLLAG